MSYLSGGVEIGTVAQFRQALDTAAAAVTPTGLLWMAPAGVQQAAAKQVSPITTSAINQIAQVQGLLMQLGLYPGPVSGVLDGNTKTALDAFRKAVGLPQGGPVTDFDLGALQQAAAQMAAQTGAQPVPAGGFQPTVTPSILDQLPPWAIPAGIGLAAFLLLKK